MKKNEKKTDMIVKVFDLDGVEKLTMRCRNWVLAGITEKGEHGKPDEQCWKLAADGPFEPCVSR